MEIRKYYKNFDQKELFKETDVIKVDRVIFYLDKEVTIFIDLYEEEPYINYYDGIFTFKDSDTGLEERVVNIHKENVMFTEINKNVELKVDDFDNKNM